MTRLHIPLILISMSIFLEAFKILVFYPFPYLSHQRAIMALTERLVNDGHELFVVSPNKVPSLEKHINYTFVDLSFPYQFVSKEENADDGVVNLQRHWSKWDLPLLGSFKAAVDIPRKQLLSDTFLQFDRFVTSKKIIFDLIIIEDIYSPYACAIMKELPGSTPIITMSSLSYGLLSSEESLGSIQHLSYLPSYYGHYTDRMGILQRIENWISHHYIQKSRLKLLDASVRRYCREVYGPENERIADGCSSRISLTLIASNPLYFYPRVLGPNIIEVGPLHIKTPEKLPQNLQNWLNGAENGVIYFSLGNNMKSKALPSIALANFLRIFAELQPLGYRILWKWELDEEIPGQSSNVLAQKWIPQLSVLAHPKVKVFITQGGLQSFQEAVHFGVPMVGIPWFVDQGSNVAKIVDAGIGVQLLPKDLDSYEAIKSALEAVLYDTKYSINMKRHSALSHDFTSRALDQAVFWVEHVARHKGASHLRPSTADASLFEYFCLDIISVILFLSLIFIYFVYYVLTTLISMICPKAKPKMKSS